MDFNIQREALTKLDYDVKNLMVVFPGRSIFVYRGEEEEDKNKEICLVMWKVNSANNTNLTIDLNLKAICYHALSFKIVRGPLIQNLNLYYQGGFQFLYYQQTGSKIAVIIGGYFVYYVDSNLSRVIKVENMDFGTVSALDTPKNFLFVGINVMYKFN